MEILNLLTKLVPSPKVTQVRLLAVFSLGVAAAIVASFEIGEIEQC